ncbi:hypothetical protein [Nonlabens sp. YIK11]|uniref:hypothetical protein n=1 Tax=Nonlabens sp. YIK11 TaxID=1453349 RepID=UPI0006DCAA17|nr:hypothetical protein [Nonlabens sp. YIK11]
MFKICLFVFLLGTYSLFSQVGINTAAPDPSAMLEVKSDNSGMLMPRLTTAQKTAIATPATGLLVYDIDQESFSFYNGTAWVAIGGTSAANDFTGWADYVDTIHDTDNPFIVGDISSSISPNRVTLPNNAGTIRDTQKPIDVTTFYDSASQSITGRNGDGVNIVIEFKARPNTTTESRLTIAIDIGAPVNEIYTRDFVLSKGKDVEHFYLSSFNAYTLGTWQANGGLVKVSCTASTDIYDIRYVITRTHKAR